MHPWIALPLLLLSASATAQVYKCKGASGETMYSQDPCSAQAQPHILRNGQPAGVARSMDRQCLNDASARIYAASNDRIAALQAQIRAIGEQANNAPRQAALREAMAREHANANRQLSTARQQCLVDIPPAPLMPSSSPEAPAVSGEESS